MNQQVVGAWWCIRGPKKQSPVSRVETYFFTPAWPWVQQSEHLWHQRELALIRPCVPAEEGCMCVVLFWQHFACQWQTSCTKVKRDWTGSVLLKHLSFKTALPAPPVTSHSAAQGSMLERNLFFQNKSILNDKFRRYVTLHFTTVVIVLKWHTRVLVVGPNSCSTCPTSEGRSWKTGLLLLHSLMYGTICTFMIRKI